MEVLEIHRDEYVFHSPVTVELQLDNEEAELRIRGDVSLPAQVECARCLGLFSERVETQFSARYLRCSGLPEPEGDTVGGDEEAVHCLPPDASEVDLTDEVRQAILVSLPIRTLCGESCRGLCPVCGTNLNESQCGCERPVGHPAWSALARLKKPGGSA